MWSAGTEVMDLYIGTRATLLSRGGEAAAAQRHNGFDEACTAVARLCQGIKPTVPLRVWLSGGLCRPFLLPPTLELKDSAERLRVAQAIARQSCALQGELELRLMASRDGAPQIGMALEKQVLDAILQCLAGRRLKGLSPWWMEALNALLKQQPSLQCIGVQDCDALTVLQGNAGVFHQASTLAPSYELDSAKAGYRRMQFAASLAPDQCSPLLALRGDGGSKSEHDGQLPARMALSSFASMED